MGYTAVEKILMKHSVKPVDKVSPGDILTCNIDYAGMHEGFDAKKYEQFTSLGRDDRRLRPIEDRHVHGTPFLHGPQRRAGGGPEEDEGLGRKAGHKGLQLRHRHRPHHHHGRGICLPRRPLRLRRFPYACLRRRRRDIRAVRYRDVAGLPDRHPLVQGA